MNEPNSCECSAAPTLIFACSGAADVGEITDLVARKLTREGIGKMFCLAGVGGRVDPILETTKAAEQIVIVCHRDQRRAVLADIVKEDVEHPSLVGRIEVAGRLVGQKQRRLG